LSYSTAMDFFEQAHFVCQHDVNIPKLPSSLPRYVKSASFLEFHVVRVCFWTIGSIWTTCSICGFLRAFVAKKQKNIFFLWKV
jgi:hypothetical protein